MTTLETVIEMQRKGMTDLEISRTMQSQGISPKDINDALNQAKIKSAVAEPTGGQVPQQQQMNQPPAGGQASITETGQTAQTQPGVQNLQTSNMQGQMPQQQPAQQMQQQASAQPSMTQGSESMMQQGAQPSMMQAPQQDYYPEEALYSEGEYYGGGEGGYYNDGAGGGYADTETIAEIAAQVVDEKFREYNKRTGDMSVFKTMIEDKVNNIEERLGRIETTIDKLQHAVVQKIGEFGENTTAIRKDLENLHNTTSKLYNPLVDNMRELERTKGKRTH